jgi:hypothetical protein
MNDINLLYSQSVGLLTLIPVSIMGGAFLFHWVRGNQESFILSVTLMNVYGLCRTLSVWWPYYVKPLINAWPDFRELYQVFNSIINLLGFLAIGFNALQFGLIGYAVFYCFRSYKRKKGYPLAPSTRYGTAHFLETKERKKGQKSLCF